jgi:hypothetical protein
VEALNKSRKEADTVNVLWTQFGEEQRQLQTFRWRKMSVGRLGNESQPGSSLNDPWLRWSISSGVNHQLESRMQEICQSGSEGGAKLTFVPTPISAQALAWVALFLCASPVRAPENAGAIHIDRTRIQMTISPAPSGLVAFILAAINLPERY